MTQFVRTKGKWERYQKVRNNDEKSNEPSYEWVECPITKVPTSRLIEELEILSWELTTKEIELTKIKTDFAEKEFNIKYVEDINFKDLYGKANDDTRNYHVNKVCKDLIKQKTDLELSIDFLKREINLFKTVIYFKQNNTPQINPYPINLHLSKDDEATKKRIVQAFREAAKSRGANWNDK